jgi:hypothetical protein
MSGIELMTSHEDCRFDMEMKNFEKFEKGCKIVLEIGL